MRQPQGFWGSPNSVITWILPNWAKEKEPKRKPFGIPWFHSKLFEFRTKSAEGHRISFTTLRVANKTAFTSRLRSRTVGCFACRLANTFGDIRAGLNIVRSNGSLRCAFVLRTHALTRGTHGEPRAGIVSPDEQVKFTVTHGFARRLHSRLSLWSLSAHDPIGVNHIALRYQIPASPNLYEYTARQRRNSSFSMRGDTCTWFEFFRASNQLTQLVEPVDKNANLISEIVQIRYKMLSWKKNKAFNIDLKSGITKIDVEVHRVLRLLVLTKSSPGFTRSKGSILK